MSQGTLRSRHLKSSEQFSAVDDLKLQMTLVAISDKFSQSVRELIYHTYQDDRLASIYRQIRNTGAFEKGSKSKTRRKIIEFPNPFVFDFVDTVLSTMYGKDWMDNNNALKHDLVRPWWVVSKL